MCTIYDTSCSCSLKLNISSYVSFTKCLVFRFLQWINYTWNTYNCDNLGCKTVSNSTNKFMLILNLEALITSYHGETFLPLLIADQDTTKDDAKHKHTVNNTNDGYKRCRYIYMGQTQSHPGRKSTDVHAALVNNNQSV